MRYFSITPIIKVFIFCLSIGGGYTTLFSQGYCAEVDFTYDQKDDVVVFKGESKEIVLDWYWYFGDGGTEKGAIVRHKYDKSGEFEICLKIIVSPSCTGSVCKKLKVGSLSGGCDFRVDFGYSTDGTNGVFNAKSNDDLAKYYWYVSGNNVQYEGKDIRIPFEKEGIFEVCLIGVNSSYTCKEQVCKKIEIGRQCDFDADFNFTVSDNIVKVFAKSTAGNAAGYFWSFGDGDGSEGIEYKHQYTNRGEYELCLKVVAPVITVSTSAKDCVKVICKKITIGAKVDDCVLNTDFSYITNGKSLTFTARSNDEKASYYWYVNGVSNPLNGKDVTVLFDNDGTYEVCLTAVNGAEDCKVRVCKKVTVGSKIKIFPNPAFDVLNIVSDQIINQIWIYNQVNELKIEKALGANNSAIDVTGLDDGMYMILLETENGNRQTQRFFKKG
jgi:PKD repeat protein